MDHRAPVIEHCGNFKGLRQAVTLLHAGSLDMAMTRLGKTLEEMIRSTLVARGVKVRDNTALDGLLSLFKLHVESNPRLLTHAHSLRTFRNVATHTSVEFQVEDVRGALFSFLTVVSSAVFMDQFPDESEVALRLLEHLTEAPMALTDAAMPRQERVRYYDNVGRIYDKLHQAIVAERQSGKPVVLENIGLDHETVWPYLRDSILAERELGSISCKLLIVDPNDELLQDLCSDHISLAMAQMVLDKWSRFIARTGTDLAERDITVEYRTNKYLPVVHGLCVNRKYLFWSFSHFGPGPHLRGGDAFYHYCEHDPDDPVVLHYFKVYSDWFDFYWGHGGQP
jgi:hypothetical protein